MTSLSTPSVLADLLDSPDINAAIEQIVNQIQQAGSRITEARPADPELQSSYQDWLDRLAAVKGKGALYPYVGEGIGNGPLVQLADGSVKWDMINGIGVQMFGHSDPRMIETAIRAAMSDVVMQGNLQFNRDVIEFSELLVEQAGRTSNIRHCFLANSGAMVNEHALKICYQKKDGKAPRIIAFADCFMGRTTTMAQIGDSAAGRVGIPLNTQVDYMPFFDPDLGEEESIRSAVQQLETYLSRYPGQHACFAMELVQGEGGFNGAPPRFFEALMRICRDNDVPVWIDEIQTFGRTEQMFHFEQLGLGDYVDVVTIGKMSQVCALLYTEALNPKPGLLSGTFVGSTVGLQVGKRILETLRDGGYYGSGGSIAQLHQAFRQRAAAFVQEHPEWFPPVKRQNGTWDKPEQMYGGVGGMMRITPFGGDKAQIMKALHTMFDNGVIAFICGHGPYHIRFLPPVGVMQPALFDNVFSIVEQSLAQVAAEH